MKTTILSIICIALLSSCASILQWSKQAVTIATEPPTGKIYVDDEYLGTGYICRKFKRSKSHSVVIKHDEYVTRYMTIENHLQPGWLIADLLFGVIPIVVDAGTGAWHAFDKDHYIIPLEKK